MTRSGTRKTRSVHIKNSEASKAGKALANPKASKTAKTEAAIILNELRKT